MISLPCAAVWRHRPSARGHCRRCNSSCYLAVTIISDGSNKIYWMILNHSHKVFFLHQLLFLPGILSRWWRGWARFFHICRSTVFHIKHKPSLAAFHALCSWEASPLPSLGCLEARTHTKVYDNNTITERVCVLPMCSDTVVFVHFHLRDDETL